MSNQVVRISGYSKGSLTNIGLEAERSNIEYRNEDIDTCRTYLNVELKKTKNGFYAEYHDIRNALNAHGKETKNAVAFEGMIITSDKAFFESLGWRPGVTMSPEVEKFFLESYEWAKSTIGYQGTDKNILSAMIHVDEKTPHLQLYYLPITDKWQEKVYAKDENGKVRRTEKGTPIQEKDNEGNTIFKQVEDTKSPKHSRTEFWRIRGGNQSYRRMQDSYHGQIATRYRLERGDIGSDREHTTKQKWRAKQEEEKIQKEKMELEKEIKLLEEKKEVLTKKEVEELKGEKTITGGLKGVTYAEYETLKKTALKAEESSNAAQKYKTELEYTKNEYSALKKGYEKLKIEIIKIKGIYEKVLGYLEKQFPEVWRRVNNMLSPNSLEAKIERAKDIAAENRSANNNEKKNKDMDR